MTQDLPPQGGGAPVPPPFPGAYPAWPPPPPAPPHPRLMGGRRLAAVAALTGLVAGSAVAGFVIAGHGTAPTSPVSDAAAESSSTASPTPGTGDHPGLRGLGVDLLQQAAGVIGVSTTTLRADLRDGQTVADVAAANGKTAQDVVTALTSDLTTAIDKAVSDGRLTSAQASQLTSHLTQMLTDFVNSPMPAGGPGHAPAAGEGAALQAAAKAIGVSAATLASDLRTGQTVAAVAATHNVSASSVEKAVVTAVDSRIQELVSSGRLTAAQASTLTAQASQRVDTWVTETYPGWPFGPFGGDPGSHPGGPWHPAASQSGSPSGS